ncbi:uncharacterized protein LOC142410048 [Mycteria americana]|uniref:uncharacterized protein LOC142410048 n=1 Tax=Mycteria americana TaxID=33587 RepID=UPI003F5803AF
MVSPASLSSRQWFLPLHLRAAPAPSPLPPRPRPPPSHWAGASLRPAPAAARLVGAGRVTARRRSPPGVLAPGFASRDRGRPLPVLRAPGGARGQAHPSSLAIGRQGASASGDWSDVPLNQWGLDGGAAGVRPSARLPGPVPALRPDPGPRPARVPTPGPRPGPAVTRLPPGPSLGFPTRPRGAAGCAAVESGKLVTWKVCRWCSAPLRMPCVQDFGPDAPRQRIPSRGPGLWRGPGMWRTAPDAEPRAAEGPGVGPA